MTLELLRAAKDYTSVGISVIPINPITHSNPKAPMLSKWGQYQNERPPLRMLEKWWGNGSKARLAVLTGRGSHHLAVLDIDNLELAQRVLADKKFLKDETSVVTTTPRGGVHIYFREKQESKGATHFHGVGDIRGQGGYVVAPPSEGYTLVKGDISGRIRIIDNLREWILDVFMPYFGLEEEAEDEDIIDLTNVSGFSFGDVIDQGQRNETLFKAASSMRGKGWSLEAIYQALLVENNDRCKPPLDVEEVRKIAESASTKEPNAELFPFTDAGNAERLIAKHGRDLRYVEKLGWFIWNGKYWEHDDTLKINALATDTAYGIADEASPNDKADIIAGVRRWAAASQSESHLRAMVNIARSKVAINEREFDKDPYLLTVKNGTINLKTGQLQSHTRADMITHIVDVDYKMGAECPMFKRFLRQILPGKELRNFVWKMLGYSLTGDVSEECLFMLYGSGQNGKSTLVETINQIMGEYARVAPSDLLVQKLNDEHPQSIADLKGRRFVVTSEPENGKRLAESKVKILTGGESISARRMYGSNFVFRPTFKLFLVTNHKLQVRGTDKGIWRRIKLVPFEVTIPDEQLDRKLQEKLRAEYRGILTWLVDGCLRWQKQGLGDSPEIADATRDYREESDVIGAFFDEQCVMGTNESALTSALYRAYSTWANTRGEHPMSQTSFGKMLKERGFQQSRATGGARIWKGLRVKKLRA